MIKFIYGRTGTGKTRAVFESAELSASDGHRVFVLVPEREAVGAEKIAAELPHAANIDVVTFTRLCNYIFRREGDIAGLYIGKGAKKVIMHGVRASLSGALKTFGAVSVGDTAMTETLVSAASELRRNAVTPRSLETASEKLDGKLGDKLADLSLIISEYNRQIEAHWRDPDGMLEHATDLATTGGFFVGCDVYIDSFSAFTAEQLNMLGLIFNDTANVTVTLPYDNENDAETQAFMTVADTDKKLHRIIADENKTVDEMSVLHNPTRFESPALAYLSKNLWRGTPSEPFGHTDDIKIVRAANVYAEAESVAVDIMRQIHGGMRYSDIAVVVRSTEEYSGIIDAVMDKYGIPYFISSRADITESPLCKFILTSLSVNEHGFPAEEIIALLKTDLYGIDADECNLFENYIIKWNIHGKAFGDEFVLNPRGYYGTPKDSEKETLKRVNAVREKIWESLAGLSANFTSCKTVREYSRTVFDFLNDMKIPSRLKNTAAEYKADGAAEDAATIGIMWRTFCDALDQLVTSAGDRTVSLTEYRALLRIVLSDTDIGRIPTSVDEVTIADPVLTNVSGAAAVYIMGCYDGGFPRRVSDDGIFTDNEKERLSYADINISTRMWKKLSDEMFFFFCAACSATKKLTVSYPHYNLDGRELKPSAAVERLENLFENLTEYDFEKADRKDLLYGENAAYELSLGNDILSDAIKEYCGSSDEYKEKFKYLNISNNSKECRLSDDCKNDIFGGNLKLSYSSLEQYIKCNFEYFCDNYLHISDDTPASFSALNIGSFMHRILELGVRTVVENPDVDDETLKAMIDEIADGYIKEIGVSKPSGKLKHVSNLLSGFAFDYITGFKKECAISRFVPSDYEVRIGIGDDRIKPMSLDGNGITINLSGIIDRVDVYKNEADGKAYVRIVDYKTGNKTFKIDDIKNGINLQLLLYLFSIWENGKSRYGADVVPAGAEYVLLNMKQEDVSETAKSYKKSGIYISNAEILNAMDSTPKKSYISVTQKEINAYDETADIKNLASEKKFSELKENVQQTVLNKAADLKKGIADAKPMQGDDSPCQYCRFNAICRVKKPKGR